MRAEPFSLGGMPALRWGRPSRRGILYLHGQGGSKAEAAFFAAAAADARVDNRVMFSVGRAARSLGLLGASATLVLGIPLSVSGKSPFFDRKPKK